MAIADTLLPLWSLVTITTLAATLGAMVAALFDGVKIGTRTFLLATAVPAALAFLLVDRPVPVPFALWSVVLILGLTGLAVIDAATRTVPDLLCLPLIVLGLVHAEASEAPVAGYATTSIAILILGAIVARVAGGAARWIGGGDVLLLSGAAAWFGPAALPDLVIVASALLLARLAVAPLIPVGPVTCIPITRTPDRDLPLAPTLGTAQILLWFGGPIF